MSLRPLGLYLHIPFCRRKCAYCDFYSLPRGADAMDAYERALCARLDAFAPRAAEYAVDTVYFGGGTPSLFGAARLVRVLETVRRHYRVADGAEITLEANPESARDPDALHTLREAGFNRISLGAQSFRADELRLLGRVHTPEQTVEAVRRARAAGFDNLSLDLIYALPGQSYADWEKSLLAAAALKPEHLSCYALKLEQGTPLDTPEMRRRLPDADAQAEWYVKTVSLLRRLGLRQYEISNFARPGRESRHNLKYWTLGEYLGFGPGAHSDFGGRRFAFARDLDAFLAGNDVWSENAAPSARERDAERVMLSLRTVRGLDPRELGVPFDPALPFLQECAAHGLAEYGGGRWQLTPRGFFVSNAVIARVQELLGL